MHITYYIIRTIGNNWSLFLLVEHTGNICCIKTTLCAYCEYMLICLRNWISCYLKQLIIVTKTINYRKILRNARYLLPVITTDNFWGFFSFTYVLIKSAILPKTTINIGGNNG